MHLNFLMSTISDLAGIPLTEYDETGLIINIFFTIEDDKNPQPSILVYIEKILTILKSEVFSIQYLDGLPICICGCKINQHYYIWGPVAIRNLNQLEKKRYSQITNNKADEIMNLSYSNIKRLLSVVALIYSTVSGKECNTDDILRYLEIDRTVFPSYDAQMVEYQLHREDTLLLNHTYVEEQVLLDPIRNGDVESLKQLIKVQQYRYPLIIEDNILKNEEYMAIAFLTTAARAAIEGGTTSAEAFAISDVYLKRISKCRSIQDIKKNKDEAAIVFSELVLKYKQHQSSNHYVEDCKRYISQNLFRKVSLTDIAKALQLNASYLSKIFSKSEGMTISDFIQREKINAAKNMLKYSDRSIYEVSEYLQFSTHSYFTSIFKKLTDMTPQEYRSKNHPPEF
jgi:AraC-like DNA-binding protein